MNFIELGRHKIEVCVYNGIRMVKHSDVKELLDLKDEEITESFVDAGMIAEILTEKIFITRTATKEQEIIHKGLCMVGIYPLIDAVCEVDLKDISYLGEFSKLLNPSFGETRKLHKKIINAQRLKN